MDKSISILGHRGSEVGAENKNDEPHVTLDTELLAPSTEIVDSHPLIKEARGIDLFPDQQILRVQWPIFHFRPAGTIKVKHLQGPHRDQRQLPAPSHRNRSVARWSPAPWEGVLGVGGSPFGYGWDGTVRSAVVEERPDGNSAWDNVVACTRG